MVWVSIDLGEKVKVVKELLNWKRICFVDLWFERGVFGDL